MLMNLCAAPANLMTRLRPLLLLLLLLLLTLGCRAQTPVEPTPTPFPAAEISIRPLPGEPITLALSDLSANPEFFEGALLRLRGGYQRLPRLICEGEAHPSPASWGLVGDSVIAYAGGLDSELRAVLAPEQIITAEGRWLKWRGPVGCGKQAQVETIWYLSASRIIDPNPLTRATSTAGAVAVAPSPIVPTAVSPEVSPTVPTTSTAATTPLPTVPTATPLADGYPAPATATAAAVTSPAVTATVTLSGTLPAVTATALTPQATGTITTTATPGGTAVPGTPTLTPTPNGSAPENQGEIDFEDLQIAALPAGVVHAWTVEGSAGDTLTVTAAGAPNANMVLSVIGVDGATLVNRQNNVGVQRAETIQNLNLSVNGEYIILVEASGNTDIEYALMVLDSSSEDFVFRGELVPGTPASSNLDARQYAYWFFFGEAGDTATIQIDPDPAGDPILFVFEPNALLGPYVDDSGPGQSELIDNYDLPLTGLYAVEVSNYEDSVMSYTLRLNLP